MLNRWSRAAAILLLMSACDEPTKVAEIIDTTAPVTHLEVSLAGGRTLIHPPGTPLLSKAEHVRVTVRADEPCEIVYSTDGQVPALNRFDLPRGGRAVTVSLANDTTLQWLAVDVAGNVGAVGSVEVRFDREAPELFIDPAAGEFDGPTVVTLDASEPVILHYTTNGRWPVIGTEGTVSVEAPVSLPINQTTEINVLAVDPAGNRAEAGPLLYVVDTEAPTSWAEPGGGWYPSPVEVDLHTTDEAAEIHFTTDGSAPDEASAVWPGPRLVAEATTLQFRAVDAGGNLEPVQVAEYRIGARTAPAVARQGATVHQTAGGLALATALLDLAGPLGATGHSMGMDWMAWATGRAALDATLFRSAVGQHAMYAPALVTLATGGDGLPDANENGSNLDDTWWGRLDALAASVGATLPEGLHPVTLPFIHTRPKRLVAAPRAFGADGRPVTEDAYQLAAWEGARVDDKRWTPQAFAAGLNAYAARGAAGLLGRHAGGDRWSQSAGPVIGLRCGGCHRVGAVPPALDTASAVMASGLVQAGDAQASVLMRFLDGSGAHGVEPVPAAQGAAVAQWINEGAVAVETAPRKGAEPREALLGLLAWDTAGMAISHLAASALINASTGEPASAASDGPAYPGARYSLGEGAVAGGLPRRIDQIRLDDRALDVVGTAELIAALARVAAGDPSHGALFGAGPLAGSNAPGRAAALLPRLVEGLVDAQHPGGGFPLLKRPGAAGDVRTNTEATAAALWALRAAEAAGVEAAGPAAGEAWAALRQLRDSRGDYVDAAEGELEPRRLMVQLTVLRALLVEPAGGAQAEALWIRLERSWWDEAAGAWATTWGDAAYVYDAALLARALEVVALGLERLPEAAARGRSVFVRIALGHLLLADSWLTGEIEPGVDVDGDGRANPESAVVDGETGWAPVFSGGVRF